MVRFFKFINIKGTPFQQAFFKKKHYTIILQKLANGRKYMTKL